MSTPIQLKPMAAGDILDAAIRIYRQNFIPLLIIVAIVTVPILLVQTIAIAFVLPLTPDLTTPPDLDPTGLIALGGTTAIAGFLGALFSIFQLGVLTYFVSERFLGRIVTVRQAYGRAFKKWLPLLIAAILLGLVGVALATILVAVFVVPFAGVAALGEGGDAAAGLVGVAVLCLCALIIPTAIAATFVYTRWTFWVQAIVIEDYNSTGALGRSWKLVRGNFWRVLAFLLLLAVLVYALTFGITSTLYIFAFFLPSPLIQFVVQSAVGGLLSVIIAPLQFATLTVLYYDLRIRKEGFDLQMQLQGSSDPSQDLPSLVPGT